MWFLFYLTHAPNANFSPDPTISPRPNPALVEQLKLFHRMGNRLDEENSAYRLYRLQHSVDLRTGKKKKGVFEYGSLNACVLQHHLPAEGIHVEPAAAAPDPGLAPLPAGTAVTVRCRRCRYVDLNPHQDRPCFSLRVFRLSLSVSLSVYSVFVCLCLW